MRGHALVGALALVVALVATGCARTETTTPDAAEALEVVATDFAFQGIPETVRGGAIEVNFRNEGEVAHELAFFDIGDTTFETFKEDFPELIEGGPFPDYIQSGAAIEVDPGESLRTTVTLPAGSYLLFCALTGEPGTTPAPDEEDEAAEGPPHYERGMYQEDVRVEGGDGELSAPDGEIVARDYTFDLPELKAGRNRLVFRNDGPQQWHHLIAFVYPEGIDERQASEAFEAMLEAGEEGPPPEGVPEPDEAGFTGIFSPGLGQTFELELERGRTYMFVCFVHDRSGGPPHAVAHEMYKPYTVSG